jgi:hypothetical protein
VAQTDDERPVPACHRGPVADNPARIEEAPAMHSPARSLSTLVLVAAGVGVASVVAAPPAAAASTVYLTVNCDAPVVLYGTPGDTVVVTVGAGCLDGTSGFGSTVDGYLDNPTNVVNGTVDRDQPRNWWVLSDGSGTTTITTELMPTSTNGPIGVGVEVGYFGNDGRQYQRLLYGGPVPAGSGGSPAPWIQAYSRPDASTACAVGYAPSWAQWPGDGAGGWTCERSIVWSPATGSWVETAGAS